MKPTLLLTSMRWAAAYWPRTTLTLTHAVAHATWPLERRFDPEAVREVLPDLGRAELRRARRAAWSSALKRRVLEAARGTPGAPWPYPRIVSGPDPAALSPPMVLTTFHIGPMPALSALLERLPAPTLALQGGEGEILERPRLNVLSVDTGDPWQRAYAYRRALAALASGAFVFIAGDGRGTTPIHAPLFGRTVGVARGAVALALRTGAPILPLAARWRGPTIEIVTGDLIPPGDEGAMAAGTTRFLEDYVRATPEEVDPSFTGFLHGLD